MGDEALETSEDQETQEESWSCTFRITEGRGRF